eukprot:scaffold731_cov261-Pinguiococcus_pyrenoidosus.AAC.110
MVSSWARRLLWSRPSSPKRSSVCLHSGTASASSSHVSLGPGRNSITLAPSDASARARLPNFSKGTASSAPKLLNARYSIAAGAGLPAAANASTLAPRLQASTPAVPGPARLPSQRLHRGAEGLPGLFSQLAMVPGAPPQRGGHHGAAGGSHGLQQGAVGSPRLQAEAKAAHEVHEASKFRLRRQHHRCVGVAAPLQATAACQPSQQPGSQEEAAGGHLVQRRHCRGRRRVRRRLVSPHLDKSPRMPAGAFRVFFVFLPSAGKKGVICSDKWVPFSAKNCVVHS